MGKKVKKPGRVRLSCVKCNAEFSTHSSNRTLCHKCKPKCMERHYFHKKTAPKHADMQPHEAVLSEVQVSVQ